jgi:hypothetical protein
MCAVHDGEEVFYLGIEITKRIYELMLSLPRHDYRVARGFLPYSGIYTFFEHGETAPLDDTIVDRIVRVGTHNKDGNFPGRIRQHYGNVNSLGGNKNGSVFRKHLGGAIIRRQNPDDHRLFQWTKQMGDSYKEIETEVSQTLRQYFTFVCFSVESGEDRHNLERGLIAQLARYPLYQSSSQWLGHYAVSPEIAHCGLWNVQYTDDAPMTTNELLLLERLVASQKNRPR